VKRCRCLPAVGRAIFQQPAVSAFTYHFLDTNASEKPLVKVWLIQMIHFHFFVPGRSVNELPVANVDTDVRASGSLSFEKDKISFF
jgi:hypothetical protein